MSGRGSLLMYTLHAIIALVAIYIGLFIFYSLLVTFVLFHLITCVGIPLIHGSWEGNLKEKWRQLFSIRSGCLKHAIIAGVGSGSVLMLGVIAGFYMLLEAGVDPGRIHLILLSWGLTPDWLWIFILYMIFGNSFFEELLWRGFSFERLQRLVSLKWASMISSLYYSSYHVLLGVVLFGWKWGLLVAGLAWLLGNFWSFLVRQYHSLLSAWISHLLVDIGIMAGLIMWIM